MIDSESNELIRDLIRLGQASDVPEPSPGLTTMVMDRIAAPTAPGRFASRRRQIAVVIAAVLLALLATPPVRAAVADWFGFGGVLVEKGSSDSGPAAPPPEVTQDQTVTEAAAAVDFPVMVPEELGSPDGVEVSPDLRMVSMSWSTDEEGVVRLDQFDAGLDFSVIKQSPQPLFTTVAGLDAIWFEKPHDVALLDADGTQRTESARLAGHTLIWLSGDTTLRLEGDLSLARAKQIAESSIRVE